MRICVVGTGYVGLVAGTCFAETGNDVICVDIDEKKIAGLEKGELPIYEPGLEEVMRRNLEAKRLTFTTDLEGAVHNSLIIFIAVGTPANEDGSSDLSYVMDAARGVARAMNGYKIIVNKSTVPVGTADRVCREISALSRFQFDVVSNPEFLKQGTAVEDFMKPDRVIIGTDDVRVAEIMKELYAPFTRKGPRFLVMDTRSAEVTKYAANAILASRISFMNEIANLCEHIGADVHCVRQGIGSDRRIGTSFLFPGVGYGGSCFPKDIKALIDVAKGCNYPLELIRMVEKVNESQKYVLVDKILRFYSSDWTDQLEELEVTATSNKAPEASIERLPAKVAGVNYISQLSLDDKKVSRMAVEGSSRTSRDASAEQKSNWRNRQSPVEGKTFAVWGLSFKPQTNDMREAPSTVIISELLKRGAKIQAYDPEAMKEARKIFGRRIRYAKRNYEALENADALILVTEWNLFRNPDFEKMRSLLKHPVIFDGRNQYNPQEMQELGFVYFGIGRGSELFKSEVVAGREGRRAGSGIG